MSPVTIVKEEKIMKSMKSLIIFIMIMGGDLLSDFKLAFLLLIASSDEVKSSRNEINLNEAQSTKLNAKNSAPIGTFRNSGNHVKGFQRNI